MNKKICQYCKEEYHPDWNGRKFCSSKCFNQYQKYIGFPNIKLWNNLQQTNNEIKKQRSITITKIMSDIKEKHNASILRNIKHPLWQWGISYIPYSETFNKQFKKIIILRDNNCLVCGKNNHLHVHHIDYDKLNSIKENCVTLCNSCHSKTNFNRTQWIEFFHSLLIEKYSYCYILKEEIKNGN
jgi:hypothetical protein